MRLSIENASERSQGVRLGIDFGKLDIRGEILAQAGFVFTRKASYIAIWQANTASTACILSITYKMALFKRISWSCSLDSFRRVIPPMKPHAKPNVLNDLVLGFCV